MKNQFFGDERDLFKYDLLTQLMQVLPALKQLTFVPMLTPDTGSHGGLVKYERGGFDLAIYEFLSQKLQARERDIRHIETLFADRPLRTSLYSPAVPFITDRVAYFAGVSPQMLEHAVVFFDPDTGLEPASRAGLEHLRLREFADVMARASPDSVGVIFQFFTRESWPRFFRRTAELIRDALADRVVFAVFNSAVAFLIVTPKLHLASLARWLPEYIESRKVQSWPAVNRVQLEAPHFGYGSNMWDPWLRKDAPSARAIGKALLHGYELTFQKHSGIDDSGKGDVRRRDNSDVHGVLFDIDAADVIPMNIKEGGYTPIPVEVWRGTEKTSAWTYFFGGPDAGLLPFDWYLCLIVRGARHHDLPREYIRDLLKRDFNDDKDAQRVSTARRFLQQQP